MRKTFVLWVSQSTPDSASPASVLEGRLEDVDTGQELRFQSTEQLMAFLKECLDENRER